MFTLPLFLLSLALVGLMAAATVALVRGFDLKSMHREQELVANGMTGRINEVGRVVIPQVVWGDAVRRIDNRFDPAWAKVNILDFLAEMGGFDAIFVLDSNSKLLIAGQDGQVVGADQYRRFAAQVAPLIAEVRAAETDRARQPSPPPGVTIKTPIQSNAIISVDGQPFIMTASRVQPDFWDNRLRSDNGPIVLAAMRIDADFLSQFARRYLLRNVRLQRSRAADDADDSAAIPLIDPHGRTVARLAWDPQQPGADLLYRLAPGLAGMILLALAVAFRLFRSSRRMAKGLIASEARAAHLAYHDALTGLPNRVHFGDRLAQALAQLRHGGQQVIVFCLDLDRFKDINDSYGHAVGDELLIEAASRMAALCRESDVIARLSGDEFAIIRIGGTAAEAKALATQLCRAIARPFALGSSRLHVGCSIGISICTDGDTDPAEVLREADIALYQAKQAGKGRHCLFEHELDVAIKGRRLMEVELREALRRDLLSLAYQPQVAADGTVIGVEALIRWHHPERGEIAPAQFVPLAEQTGLILALGQFALRQAFADSQRWPGLKIAVNISAQQIRDPSFVPWLEQTAISMAVDPHMFELEITEGLLLVDDPETHERLDALSKLGFALALDDFGTGYSSLSYLHRYPIDKIKIDRSFIANLGLEAEADAVVDAIIKLARALGLGVVAEGVETDAQLTLLKRAGCRELQGFLFGRPVAAEAIEDLRRAPLLPERRPRSRRAAA